MIGLLTKSFMPAARHRLRSSGMTLAVIATTGNVAKAGCLRISMVAVKPSITGICISMKTKA